LAVQGLGERKTSQPLVMKRRREILDFGGVIFIFYFRVKNQQFS